MEARVNNVEFYVKGVGVLINKKSVLTGIILIACFFIFGNIKLASAASINEYPSDLNNHWAQKQISNWLDKAYVSGYPDGTFKPDEKTSRAEFVSMVNRVTSCEKAGYITLSDVNKNDWFYQAVASGIKQGYINGYEDGTFRPYNQIKRQEAAVIVAKIKGLDNKTSDSMTDKHFADWDLIPDWSRPSIAAVAEQGYMKGYPDQSFKPLEGISRAEAVTVLDNSIVQTKAMPREFNTAGVFGPESGTEVIENDTLISISGVTLRNIVLEGSLMISEGIGEGDCYLENVTVKGTTTIKGGGPNSIHFNNCTMGDIIVDDETHNVRIVMNGKTSTATLTMKSGASLEEAVEGADGVSDMLVDIPEGSTVILDGKLDKLNINSEKAQVKLSSQSVLTDLYIKANAKVSGKGRIDKAHIEADGASITQTPGITTISEGIEASVAGKKVRGGPDGSPLTTVSHSHSSSKVTLEPNPIMVMSYQPANGARDVAVKGPLSIKFNKAVYGTYGKKITIKKAADDSIFEEIDACACSGSWKDPKQIIIKPHKKMEYNTDYYVLIESGAFKDKEGNEYAGISDSTNWTFRTSEYRPAAISSYQPANNAGNVAVAANLIINLSNYAGKIVPGKNITIKRAADDSIFALIDTGSKQFMERDQQIIINPDKNLEHNTEYYILIDSGAFEDELGDLYAGIEDKTTWTFTSCDNNPIEIHTADDLNAIRGGIKEGWDLSQEYCLMEDIDLSSFPNWQAIGSRENSFYGSLDGNHHKITGLTIMQRADFQALFSCTNNAAIKNLNLSNINIKGGSYTAALVAEMRGGCISGCSASGDLKSGDQIGGGLVGLLDEKGELSDCSAGVDLKGTDCLGGLVAKVYDGSISNCSATGDIKGDSKLGGLIGENDSSWGGNISIKGCSASGDLKGNDNVGGLIGLNRAEKGNIKVVESSAHGDVKSPGKVGGLIGEISGANAAISNCSATGDAKSSNRAGGLVGRKCGASVLENCNAQGLVIWDKYVYYSSNKDYPIFGN